MTPNNYSNEAKHKVATTLTSNAEVAIAAVYEFSIQQHENNINTIIDNGYRSATGQRTNVTPYSFHQFTPTVELQFVSEYFLALLVPYLIYSSIFNKINFVRLQLLQHVT